MGATLCANLRCCEGPVVVGPFASDLTRIVLLHQLYKQPLIRRVSSWGVVPCMIPTTSGSPGTVRIWPSSDLGAAAKVPWLKHKMRVTKFEVEVKPSCSLVWYVLVRVSVTHLNHSTKIEHLGTVSSITCDEGGCTLTISDSAAILDDCHIGDSIAVNGACLTVTEFHPVQDGGYFKVWLANETLDRTDLGEREVGDQVNLERAMGAHVRFGGHFVQGHVDTTATIVHRQADGESLRLWFRLPQPTPDRPSLLPYLIPKGFVAIDGTSLTLTEVNDAEHTFGVMLIKLTQEKISLAKKPDGAKVNIEADMVGKYVAKSVVVSLAGEGGNAIRELVERVVDDVVTRRLAGP
ncbi:hypothetical protein V8B97DRAFT_1969714 [Scleroderma yunnanense]